MEAGIESRLLVRSKQLGFLLLWALWALPCGSSAQKKTNDSAWADQALVTGLNPLIVSNDGNSTFQANIKGSGCPTGALWLVFPKATATGGDVRVVGEMGSQCQAVEFRAATSPDFQGIKAGPYQVRLQLGPSLYPVAFAANQSISRNSTDIGNSSSDGSSTPQTNTTSITVVKAPTASFLGQSSSASRTRATVTVSVGLDGPAQLPASVALRAWDPTAVEVEPQVLTWRPGESGAREFTLRLTRAAPSPEAPAWAELVRGCNVLINASAPLRLELDTPRPAFYVVSNQAIYRGTNDSVGSGRSSSRSNGSSGGGSGTGGGGNLFGGSRGGVALSALGGAASVAAVNRIEVRRAGPSPFGSTLQYKAVVLQTTGCKKSACTAAVSGNGTLRVPPDAVSASANVYIDWGALPPEAALGVGLQLTPIDNADLATMPGNATSLYVYGNPYGVCPAGTMGPWQEAAAPSAPAVPAPDVSASSARAAQQGSDESSPPQGGGGAPGAAAAPPGGLAGSSTGPQRSVAKPAPKTACNDTALLGALVGYSPSADMLPVLSVCAGGDAVLVQPITQPDPGSGALHGVPSAPGPAGDDGGAGGDVEVELQVPFGRDAASVLVPLTSADGTVLLLGTNCSPEPRLTQAAATAGGFAGAGAATGTGATGPAAWAALVLPRFAQPCYMRLQVYGNVWTGQGQQEGAAGGNAGSSNTSRGGGSITTQPPSPSPSAAPANASSPSPVDRRRSAAEASASAAAAGSSRTVGGAGRASMRILSSVPLRTLNVTLRPLSDPDIFSAGALSLYLLHRPSGRCLPLCGLPQPMLQAAAAAIFRRGFDPASQTQLDTAATALTAAIHGDLEAVGQLQAAPGDSGGGGDSVGGGGDRRLMRAGASLRRWLAAWLPLGWAEVTPETGGIGAARRAAGGPRGHRAAGVGGSPHRRRALHQLDGGASPPAASSAPQTPSSPASGQAAGPPPALPGPGLSSGGLPPSYPGAAAGATVLADAFDLSGALDGGAAVATMRVLLNPEFEEWCHSWEPQVVDLALLAASPVDMEFVASSQGRPLQVRSSGGNGSGDGDVAELTEAALTLGPSTLLELLALGGGGNGSAAQDATEGEDDCAAQQASPRPPAEKRLCVTLVAPDGISTAALALELYRDYSAAAEAVAAAAEAAAALECQHNSSCTGAGIGNSTAAGPSSAGSSSALAAAPASPPPPLPATAAGGNSSGGEQPVIMSLPPPVSLWSACRPCGPGSFSDSANSTSCQLCGPGSASNASYNKECAVCSPGTFTTLPGSAVCRPCYAGSYTPRPGSTACTVCPDGTTSLADGAAECVVSPELTRGDALVVFFRLLLNMSAAGNASAALAASASGLDAPTDWIFRMLIAADTAAALRIAPSMVRVSLLELSPSTFLVNVSVTMPLGSASSSAPGTGSSPASSSAAPLAPSSEVDADTLISRLVDNPDDAFPRTREATGGSLQVQLLQRQVVALDGGRGGVNPHVVVWPTLAGTSLLAIALGFACRRYCRRRRAAGGRGLSLPPITDALGRLCVWKYPTSPPATTAFFAYGRFTSLELQEQACPAAGPAGALSATARQRGGRAGGGGSGGKGGHGGGALSALGMTLASDSAADMTMLSCSTNSTSTTSELDAVAMMYTRDALAAPRI